VKAPALVACSICQGQPDAWNTRCGGCGGWVLVAEIGGCRFAGPCDPYDPEKRRVVPWRGKPSADAVAVETAAMMAALAPYVIAAALAEALGA